LAAGRIPEDAVFSVVLRHRQRVLLRDAVTGPLRLVAEQPRAEAPQFLHWLAGQQLASRRQLEVSEKLALVPPGLVPQAERRQAAHLWAEVLQNLGQLVSPRPVWQPQVHLPRLGYLSKLEYLLMEPHPELVVGREALERTQAKLETLQEFPFPKEPQVPDAVVAHQSSVSQVQLRKVRNSLLLVQWQLVQSRAVRSRLVREPSDVSELRWWPRCRVAPQALVESLTRRPQVLPSSQVLQQHLQKRDERRVWRPVLRQEMPSAWQSLYQMR
jgi:hypothetical protein